MFKYIVIAVLGYLLFKIIKNGAYLAIENLFKNKQLDEPTDLVQCTQCQNFTSRELIKKYRKMDFCSEECIEKYQNSI